MIKGIAIPQVATQRSQDAYTRMSEKMGEEFDHAFVDMMIQSHKEAINFYADATRGNNDNDVKNFALGMLPQLREYLMESEQCESTLRNVSAALVE
jgi:putative membrane protein